MSLPKRRRQRKDKQENDIFETETTIVTNTNGYFNGSKKLKASHEANVAEDSSSSRECFSCKIKDEELIRCSLDSCDKFYHKKCLEILPGSKPEANQCPLHVCSTCFNVNPKNPQASKGNMLKCAKCPLAFHDKESCKVPGTVNSCCPKHFSPEKHRNYPGVKKLAFCVQCGGNKDLVLFCKSCPAAFHKHCHKTKTVLDNFTCDRCLSRKTVSFNDIVWAKFYDFRWWPALVMNPENIPKAAEEMKHFEGEFPVKFFGNDEYYWLQLGRVYPFFYHKLCIEENPPHHNFRRVIFDPSFDKAVELALAAVANQKFQAVEPTNRSKPPPYKHIKSNRPIGNVQIYTLLDCSDHNTCGCKAEDPNPCGYDSMCLNRSMCTECHEDTCDAGEKCQNMKFQKLEYAPAKPFWTETRGWGLKSLEDIKKGSFVSEYCGDLIDEEECERRIQQKQLVGDTNFYFCTLDATRIIDAGPKGNFSRFMNHSCEPNCETQKWMVLGDARIGIFAKKDIPAGSELTFDYQMDFSHFEKLKCNCNSKRCGGLIGKKPQNGAFYSGAKGESLEELSDDNDKKVVKIDDAIKANGVAKDEVKAKRRNGVAKDEVKAKKRNGVAKDDDDKTTKQNGVKKDKLLCFKCNTGGKMINCSRKKCGKSFHSRCLRPGWGPKDEASLKWVCPCHFCQKCKGSATYQCHMCPNSFCDTHVKDKNQSGRFACPKHCDSEE